MKTYRKLSVLLCLMIFAASVVICCCSLDDENLQTGTFANNAYVLKLLGWDVDWDEGNAVGRIIVTAEAIQEQR